MDRQIVFVKVESSVI